MQILFLKYTFRTPCIACPLLGLELRITVLEVFMMLAFMRLVLASLDGG